MTETELGIKRICATCSAKFYDLNRDPIVCPKCGAVFVLPEQTKPEIEEKQVEKPAVVTKEATDTDQEDDLNIDETSDDTFKDDIEDVVFLDDDDDDDDKEVTSIIGADGVGKDEDES